MKKYKFITIEPDGDGGYIIINNRDQDVIGYVTSYKPWKQWVFYSYSEHCVWSASYLRDVIDFIENETPK